MDFAERQKAVPVAAEIDKRGLQRGFNPGYLGEVDVAFDLLVFGRFKVEFFNPVAFEHRHPGFFRVARIDKHAHGHYKFSVRAKWKPARNGRLHNGRGCVRNFRAGARSPLKVARMYR